MLQTDERSVVVRASSSIFHGQEGEMLGALVVLTDITALKRLELQIRRSDRLASLGTLSAGMAHEIKNPLVSIKTFAQLLPERYQDSDFRDTFSNLIGHEIDRIDSLVNQLLRFARPAKPLLKTDARPPGPGEVPRPRRPPSLSKRNQIVSGLECGSGYNPRRCGSIGASLPQLFPQRDGCDESWRGTGGGDGDLFARGMGSQPGPVARDRAAKSCA